MKKIILISIIFIGITNFCFATEEELEIEIKEKQKIGATVGGAVGYRNIMGRLDGTLHGIGGNIFLNKTFFNKLKLSLNAEYNQYRKTKYYLGESEKIVRDEIPITFGIHICYDSSSLYTFSYLYILNGFYVGIEVGQAYLIEKYFYSPNYEIDLMQSNEEMKGLVIYIIAGISRKLSKNISLEINVKTLFGYNNKFNIGLGYLF